MKKRLLFQISFVPVASHVRIINQKYSWKLLFQPKRILGRDFVLGPLFLSSVFSDFEIDDFWHLWYIIEKPLKSLFICTKGRFLVLFVRKLRGFKILKSDHKNTEGGHTNSDRWVKFSWLQCILRPRCFRLSLISFSESAKSEAQRWSPCPPASMRSWWPRRSTLERT